MSDARGDDGRAATGEAADGVLIADKPRGPTSHDVVAEARRLYRTRHVGHAGTLDPMATGVLVLLFGRALKLSSYLAGAAKRYRAVVSLGRSTDTFDALGRTLSETELHPAEPARARILEALALERERELQDPPAFSAIKVAGRRAHQASRRGEAIELAPRPVVVDSLELAGIEDHALTLELTVSKGYYVRALARDLGARLGVPAHLAELRRTASGPFELGEATAWPPSSPPQLIPIERAATRALPSARLLERGAERARLGQKLEASDFAEEERTVLILRAAEGSVFAWFGPEGNLVALGRRDGERFRVVRGFPRSRPSA